MTGGMAAIWPGTSILGRNLHLMSMSTNKIWRLLVASIPLSKSNRNQSEKGRESRINKEITIVRMSSRHLSLCQVDKSASKSEMSKGLR